MRKIIINHIEESLRVKQKLLDDLTVLSGVERSVSVIASAFRNNHKLLLAGNGGSAADAQHIAAELVSRFGFDRPGLPAIALTTDTSILTGIGNDYSYDMVFERQLEALGSEGDVFIGLSTSGNSANIIRALKICREKNVYAIGLTGATGGKMKEFCDICINVPSQETPRIQEMHILIVHIICSIVEQEIFGKNNP